jgi:hypothetical protein
MWIAECGLRISECSTWNIGLRIAECSTWNIGLRIADCGLRIADCGLRIADCGLQNVPRRTSFKPIRFWCKIEIQCSTWNIGFRIAECSTWNIPNALFVLPKETVAPLHASALSFRRKRLRRFMRPLCPSVGNFCAALGHADTRSDTKGSDGRTKKIKPIASQTWSRHSLL